MNKDAVGVSNPNLLFVNQSWLQSEVTYNKRIIFGYFDLLGKLGGITHVMMMIFGFVLFSFSEHSYILKASKKLFIARTRNPNLLKNDTR